MRSGAPLAVVAMARVSTPAASRGRKDSSAGSATDAPSPLRNPRRGMPVIVSRFIGSFYFVFPVNHSNNRNTAGISRFRGVFGKGRFR